MDDAALNAPANTPSSGLGRVASLRRTFSTSGELRAAIGQADGHAEPAVALIEPSAPLPDVTASAGRAAAAPQAGTDGPSHWRATAAAARKGGAYSSVSHVRPLPESVDIAAPGMAAHVAGMAGHVAGMAANVAGTGGNVAGMVANVAPCVGQQYGSKVLITGANS